jgi:hypothetical protein
MIDTVGAQLIAAVRSISFTLLFIYRLGIILIVSSHLIQIN